MMRRVVHRSLQLQLQPTAAPLPFPHLARQASSLATAAKPRSSSRMASVVGGLSALSAATFMFSTTSEAAEDKKAFDSQNFKSFRLKEKIDLNHNTSVLRFDLGDAEATMGLPVASCILVRAPIGDDGKPVVRPYTPTSSDDTKGMFELVVKRYPNGVMSKHLHQLRPGDELEVKGPISKIPYKANMKKHIALVAGGTGITPMFQVINEILKNPDDHTKITLVTANITFDDILLLPQLLHLSFQHPDRFRVYYVLEKPPAVWPFARGFVTADLLRQVLPAPSEEVLVCVCGPPGMMEAVSGNKAPDYTQGELKGILKQLGYTPQQVFKF